jgi:hypothetical protein
MEYRPSSPVSTFGPSVSRRTQSQLLRSVDYEELMVYERKKRTDFDTALCIKEDIIRLDITVDDMLLV